MGNSSLSCCSNNTLVQDQVCIDWSATGAVTETVYEYYARFIRIRLCEI